jgi:hypothetical protein
MSASGGATVDSRISEYWAKLTLQIFATHTYCIMFQQFSVNEGTMFQYYGRSPQL